MCAALRGSQRVLADLVRRSERDEVASGSETRRGGSGDVLEVELIRSIRVDPMRGGHDPNVLQTCFGISLVPLCTVYSVLQSGREFYVVQKLVCFVPEKRLVEGGAEGGESLANQKLELPPAE